ncbi:MAG: response regulator transcription factor [Spirochaetes bacterium]|nr:MAG: response regulator transcription factor [Spirochaetota bacterium]
MRLQEKAAHDAKILIIEPNNELCDTLAVALTELFDKENILTSADFRDALWQAAAVFPRYVAMNYSTLGEPPDELLKRLKSVMREFQGIILYAPESEEYDRALKNKLSRDLEYRGILAVSYDELIDTIRSLLRRGSAGPGDNDGVIENT